MFNIKFKGLCFRFRWPTRRRRSRAKVVIKKLGKTSSKSRTDNKEALNTSGSAVIHPSGELGQRRSVRVATFNAALFSMAPAVPRGERSASFDFRDENFSEANRRTGNGHFRAKSMIDRPRSILKQSPLHHSSSFNDSLPKEHKFAKSKLRVSINLPDNEISLRKSGQLSFGDGEKESPNWSRIVSGKNGRSTRTVVEVLRELDADVVALQDVKAEEEKAMKPLSDLAACLGMNYVFAESWAPEYGNAILSKWPIKRWHAQKIFDDTDFRNVLKATIDVPQVGEINIYCTHLDHLDENWRMKQINAIIQSNDAPHILAGGLNSLDETDYSLERWTEIMKYYQEMGKPTPKVEVMKYLKSKQYTDAKDFAGECESVVMIAKGQSVQGTCKYGTRVDYILSSPNSPYKFVPGSYSVFSSKGTSDHHIAKVDVTKVNASPQEHGSRRRQQPADKKVVKITASDSSKGIWKTHM